MSGGPKVPEIFKVNKTSQTERTVTFSGDDASISLATSPEKVTYFDGFSKFVVTFQPVVDDDETK